MQLSKTTLNGYKREINSRIMPVFGHMKLSKIKPLDIQSFTNTLLQSESRLDGRSGTLSPASIKRYHGIMRSIMRCAVQWQLIETNPCDRIADRKSVV